MYKIAVANDKGGVGKTTTAISLASVLSSRGRTIVIDADEKTQSALEWYRAGGHVLPCEVLTMGEAASLDLSDVQYLIFDTKAGEESSDLLTLAQQVDLLIVPTKPDALSLRALVKTLAPLKLNNYRVLLTDVPPAPSTDGADARLGLLDMGVPLFNREIRRAAAFNKAALAGVTVLAVKGDQRAKLASLDYELLAREVLSIEAQS